MISVKRLDCIQVKQGEKHETASLLLCASFALYAKKHGKLALPCSVGIGKLQTVTTCTEPSEKLSEIV